MQNRNDNCVFACILYRKNNFWSMVAVGDTSHHKNFKEGEDMIIKNLKFAGMDDAVLLKTKNLKANTSRRFDLAKCQTINIPQNLTHLRVGLGWKNIFDLDAAILTLDKNGKRVDYVYLWHLKSKDGAITYTGSNDEKILINLPKVGHSIKTMRIVVNIQEDRKTWADYEGAFCRILDHYSGSEFCKFDLSRK